MYPETIRLIAEKQQEGVFPGVVYRFIHGEQMETHCLGYAAQQPQIESLTTEHLFDVASLTKVVLYDDGDSQTMGTGSPSNR